MLPTHINGKPITQREAEQLWELCKAFIVKERISCAEACHDTDDVSANATTLIEGICEIIGYYRYPDDTPRPRGVDPDYTGPGSHG